MNENCPKCHSPYIAESKKNHILKFKFKCIKNCGEEIMFNDIENHYNSDYLSKKAKVKFFSPKEAAEYKEKIGKDIPHIISKYTKKYNNYIIFRFQ